KFRETGADRRLSSGIRARAIERRREKQPTALARPAATARRRAGGPRPSRGRVQLNRIRPAREAGFAAGAQSVGRPGIQARRRKERTMGLLDSIASQVTGALAGSATDALPPTHPGLLEVVSSLLGSSQSGGLQGLVGSFEQQGLGHLIASWIGTGENLAI